MAKTDMVDKAKSSEGKKPKKKFIKKAAVEAKKKLKKKKPLVDKMKTMYGKKDGY